MSRDQALTRNGVRVIHAFVRMFHRETEMIVGAQESNAVLLRSEVRRRVEDLLNQCHIRVMRGGGIPTDPAFREFWDRHSELRRAQTVAMHATIDEVLALDPADRPSAEEIAAKFGLSTPPTVEEALRFASEAADEIRDEVLDTDHDALRDVREPAWLKPRPSPAARLRATIDQWCSDKPIPVLLIATAALLALAGLLVWLAA